MSVKFIACVNHDYNEKRESGSGFAPANSVFHNLPFHVRCEVFTYCPAPVYHLHVRPINGSITQTLNFVILNIPFYFLLTSISIVLIPN